MRRVCIGLIGVMLISAGLVPMLNAGAATNNVSLSTAVQEYLSFSLSSGSSIDFGNLTPGTPTAGTEGTVTSVTSNSANGYVLAASDGVSGSDSALLHTDAATRIADYAGTVGTPTSWTGTGMGLSLYNGTNKDAKWGTGTAYGDSNNKYAGVPNSSTTIMSKTGYSSGADTAGIGWKVDVANAQKTGSYSGSATLTVTASL